MGRGFIQTRDSILDSNEEIRNILVEFMLTSSTALFFRESEQI